MYHPLPREWLLSTNRLTVEFTGTDGSTKAGHGSGFWINVGHEKVLVTNRHVVDLPFQNKKYIGFGYMISAVTIRTFDRNGASRNLSPKMFNILVHKDDAVDIALMTVRMDPTWSSILAASMEIVAETDFITNRLEWGAQISFSSFQPWRDTVSDVAILRTGVIASDPKRYFHSDQINMKYIMLLEAFSFSGSSGSPVFANAKGIAVGDGLTGGGFREAKIVGVMSGHIRNETDTDIGFKTHTGLSYCHRSDLLLGMLRRSEPTRSLGS